MDIATPTLERITELALRQKQLEGTLEDLAKQAKEVNEQLEQVRGGYRVEGQLPLAMQEAGVEELRLVGGALVKVKKELKAPSMAADSEGRNIVLDWVEKTGRGDLIKDEVKIPFTKDSEKIEKLMQFLTELKIQFDRYRTIHPSTLLAFFRELLEKGEEVPMDELGVKEYRQSKIS